MSVRDREEDAVIARLHTLVPHLDGEPDPGFRAATRARLVAMAAVRTPEPEPVSPLRRLVTAAPAARSRLRSRLTAGLAGAALAVTAAAAVFAVATDARPGDALYGLKRGTEQTQLALAGDERAETLLNLARTRLEEVRALDGDAGLVITTLETMDEQTTEGAALLTGRALATEDDAPLDTLSDWAEVQSAELAETRADVPPAADDSVVDSLVLLADISARADGLRAALDCATGPATIGTDALGPVPALCLPEGSGTAAPGTAAPGSGVPGSGVPGEGTDPGTGTAPEGPVGTEQPAPSAPSVGGTDPGLPGTGEPGEPGEGIPPLPALPALPALPPLLPGTGGTIPNGGSPNEDAPSDGPTTPEPGVKVEVCLPPLATIGDC